MFTVCPRCALPLAVTAADLRAGQGYVRCGRCANVFNALLALSEESGIASAAIAPGGLSLERDTASATLSRPALQEPEAAADQQPVVEPEPAAEEATAEREQLSEWVVVAAPQETPAPPEPSEPAIDLDDTGEFRGTSTFETIILEGDTFLQTEETISEEVMASELANVSRRIAEANGNQDTDEDGLDDDSLDGELVEFVATGAAFPEADELDDLVDLEEAEQSGATERYESVLSALREATGEFRHEANLGVSTDAIAEDLAAPKFRPGWRTLTAAAVLALVLIGQAINHWRDDLATHPAWYGSMQRLAALLGEPLRPNWDLNAYDVRQLGATDGGPDSHGLRVRLRLANVGLRPQALPLLRLTLLDRYGKAVSRGELQPSQYLPPQLSGLRFIARDQRIDTEVRVLDPSQQASSFELDVCVAAARGLRCAGETPVAAGHS